MRAAVKQRQDRTGRPTRLRGLQLSVIVWLTVVWVALWGTLSVFHVVAGVLVAVVVCVVFPLPPLRMEVRIRPLRLAWLVLRFLADVVAASAEVSWKTLQFGREPRNAVIEVDLKTQSDIVLTVVAEMVSLVPGSLVVEARRSTHTLFLHVLDVGDVAGVDKFRTQVFALERRVVLALGTQVEHLDEPDPSRASPPESRPAAQPDPPPVEES